MHVSAINFKNIYEKKYPYFPYTVLELKKNLNMSYHKGPQVTGSKEM